MKKHRLIVLLIMMIMIMGCNKQEKTNIKDADNKVVENTPIVDDSLDIDVTEPTFEDTETKLDTSNNKENEKPIIKDNVNNNQSVNNSKDNNSSDKNNNSDKKDSNDDSKLIAATKKYSCNKMFDYKLEGEKCVRREYYKGNISSDQKDSCPNGYVYKLGKCYIKKRPNEVKYCVNEFARMEGDFCVSGDPYDAFEGTAYSKHSIANPKVIYAEEAYIDYAKLNCPASTTKVTDDNSKKSNCVDASGNVILPYNATCSKDSFVLKNENGYYCSGTKYYYYGCHNGHRLVGRTCTPGESVRWGMYCDDNSEVINSYCQYVTDVKPTVNYTCYGTDKKVAGDEPKCLHEEFSDPIITYKCPNGYEITLDNKCKSIKKN